MPDSPLPSLMDTPIVKRYLPWVVATALFMEQLDSTIVNTAIPAMATSLQVAPFSLKAVVTSYILSLAVCIPISGWMADRFGTRRVFAIAVALFTLSSILCGLSVNVPMLVAARTLQGIGAAMMMPVGRLAIIRTYPKSELLMAMNFVIIPALIGPLLGPTVGGLIVHWLSWREIFFVNIPVGLAALYLIHRYMPDYRGESTRPLDLVGLVLFGSGMRSEEHTSELQSPCNLVCRLLLAKKKKSRAVWMWSSSTTKRANNCNARQALWRVVAVAPVQCPRNASAKSFFF